MNRNAGSDGVPPAPAVEAGKEEPTAAGPSKTGGPALLSEQQRAAEVEKQLDEIRGLVVDGSTDPAARSLLLEKITHAEPAVRSAALQGVVALNDSNAIPRLEEAEQVVENPREKVAIMDAIAYLKLPETMPETPPTNDLPGMDFSQPLPQKSAGPNAQTKRAPSARAARRLERAQARSQKGAPPTAVPQAPPAAPAPSAPPQ